MAGARGTALIGGGTGFIGKHLATVLRANGYKVKNISRRPAPNNVSWLDLSQDGLPEETRACVNLAGQNVMDFTRRWTTGFRQNVESSRVNTTRMLSSAINKDKNKPRVLVVVTGVGAYEPSDTAEYDESSRVKGVDFFSNLTIKWEEAAYVHPPVRLVIIRSGVVLGREGGMIKNMFVPFWLGLGGPVGTGKQYLPWIHVDDLTKLISFAIENEKVCGVLNGVAPQIVTNNEFTKSFSKALRRPAIIPVPEFVVNTLLHPERAMLLTKGQKVHVRRTLDYGFEFTFPDIDSACADVAHLLPKKRVQAI